MKRQILVRCIGMGVVSCFLLAGCKERNVNYDMNGATEVENSLGGKIGVKQFADAPAWTDEWTVQTSKGNEVELSIDADIIVPAAEQMSVVEVREVGFDKDYKASIAKQIFGNEEVYYNDIAHLTKKDLAELHVEYESMYEAYVAGKLEWEQAKFMLKMEEYDALMEEAKDSYTPAEDFTVDEYWGNRTGIPYNLNFVEEEPKSGCRGRSIFLSPRDVYQVCPQKYRKTENLTYEVWDMQSHGILAENSCELSEEEAKREAQSFAEHLELEYSVYAYTKPLVWGDSVKRSEWTMAGYAIYFGFGIDEIAFTEFGTEENYWNFVQMRKAMEEEQYSLDACMAVYVADTGVIGAAICNPIETTGISERIELLPLEDIQGIIKEQLTSHLGIFRFCHPIYNAPVNMNEMELIYFRMRDRKKPGCYSYVPTWRLADVLRHGDERVAGIQNQVLINAIDGSVIDFYKEMRSN